MLALAANLTVAHVIAAFVFSLMLAGGLGLIAALVLRDLPRIRAALAPLHVPAVAVDRSPAKPALRRAQPLTQAGPLRASRLAAAA